MSERPVLLLPNNWVATLNKRMEKIITVIIKHFYTDKTFSLKTGSNNR